MFASFSSFSPCDFPISAAATSSDSSFLAIAPSFLPCVTVFAYPFLKPFAYIRPYSLGNSPTTALLFNSGNQELLVASGETLTLWDFRSATLRHSVQLNASALVLKCHGISVFVRTAAGQLLSLDAHTLRRPKEIGNFFCRSFALHETRVKIFVLTDEGAVNVHEISGDLVRSDRCTGTKSATDIFVIGNCYFLASLARVLVLDAASGDLLHIVDAVFTLEDDPKIFFRGFFSGNSALLVWRSDGSQWRVGTDGSRKLVPGNFRSVAAMVSEELVLDTQGHVVVGNSGRKIFPIKKEKTEKPRTLFPREDGNLFLVTATEMENLCTGERSPLAVPEYFGTVTAVASVDRKFLVLGSSSGQVAVLGSGAVGSEISSFSACTPVAVVALAPTGMAGEFAVVDATNALGIFSIRGERKMKIRPAVDLTAHAWEISESGTLKFPTLKYTEDWDVAEGALLRSAFGTASASRASGRGRSEIFRGISVLSEGLEFSLEGTNFAALSERFYDRILETVPLGLRSPGGYALLFDWRAEQRRQAFLREAQTAKDAVRVPLGAQRRSRSLEESGTELLKNDRKKKSVWSSWVSFFLDAKFSVSHFVGEREREQQLIPFFRDHAFSFKTLLEGLRSGFALNRVLAYNHVRRLLKEFEPQAEKNSQTGDSRSLVYFIAMSAELDLRSPLFPAVAEPLLRLAADGDPTAEKIFCEVFEPLMHKRLSAEELQRLLTTLIAPKKTPKKNPGHLTAPNPLLTVAEAELDTFLHEIVASEIRRGRVETLALLVALVRRSPRKILKKLENFGHGVMRCVELLGERKKVTKELTLLLNALVEKFPMVAFHKASQRLLCGTLDSEIILFDLRNFHEKKIAKTDAPVSALAVNADAELVACLAGQKISVFRVSSHHGSFFSLFSRASHAHHAAPVHEFAISVAIPHPLSLATPLDALRVFWPSEDVLILIDDGGHEHRFSLATSTKFSGLPFDFPMFRLVVITDEIALPPSTLKQGSHVSSLRRVIEEKYVDRVVPDVGLVVALYDVLEIKECFIFPGDFRDSFGEAASTSTFRLAVFRPEAGDLLRGRIIESTTTGIRVSLEFFNDIEIPAHELMQPAFFDARNKIWIWQHQDDQFFPYEIGAEILFKVKSVSLGSEISIGDNKRIAITHRPAGAAPSGVSAAAGEQPLVPMDEAAASASTGPRSTLQPPMLVIGSVNESGMGPLLWWGSSSS